MSSFQWLLAGFAVEELQADEIRTFTGSKSRPTWILANDRSLVPSLAFDRHKELRDLDRKAKELGVSRSELIRPAIKRLLVKG